MTIYLPSCFAFISKVIQYYKIIILTKQGVNGDHDREAQLAYKASEDDGFSSPLVAVRTEEEGQDQGHHVACDAVPLEECRHCCLRKKASITNNIE